MRAETASAADSGSTTSSAPMSLSQALGLLEIAITRAPIRRASCTANMPVLPEAPTTTAASPALRPAARRAWYAVSAETGRLASRSQSSRAPTLTTEASGTTASSAKPPFEATPRTPPTRHSISLPERHMSQRPQKILG